MTGASQKTFFINTKYNKKASENLQEKAGKAWKEMEVIDCWQLRVDRCLESFYQVFDCLLEGCHH